MPFGCSIQSCPTTSLSNYTIPYKASPHWAGLIQLWDVFFKCHAWKTLWGSGPLDREKSAMTVSQELNKWDNPLGEGLMEALWIKSPHSP